MCFGDDLFDINQIIMAVDKGIPDKELKFHSKTKKKEFCSQGIGIFFFFGQ